MNNSKSNQALKIGDVVKLKSGGPTMTIHSIDKSGGWINCQWFAGDKLDKLENGYFSPDSLQLVAVEPHKKGTAKSKGNF